MGANIIVTELVFVVAMIVSLVVTWPDPPLMEIVIGAVFFNIIFPMFFYPFSKTVWMAFDLAFHPPDSPPASVDNRDSLGSRSRSDT